MNIKDFLTELTFLSNKYGVKIEGCGCCGSPFLAEIEAGAIDGYYKVNDKNENLRWIPKEIVADRQIEFNI